MNKYVLNDIFTSWKTGGGVMSLLTNNNPVPWAGMIDPVALDLEYHGNRSGYKFVAPLVMEMLEEDGTITSAAALSLVKLAYIKYGKNWAKLWAADIAQYNPISNYDMTETSTDTTTGTNTGTRQTNASSENTGESETNTETNGKNSIFGFDSSTAVDANADSSTNSGTTTTNGTTTTTGSETTNGSDTRTNTHTLTRSGNIGVTTSGQMVTQEHELWANWSFFEQVYKDVDAVLCTAIFADRRDADGIYQIVKQYVLPVATSAALGGVKADPATGEQLTPIGIRDGKLYYKEGGGGSGAVTSVNGQTGDVVVSLEDLNGVSMTTFDDFYETIYQPQIEDITGQLENKAEWDYVDTLYGTENPPPYPVTSVNGQTGDVEIPSPSTVPTSVFLEEINVESVNANGYYPHTTIGNSLVASANSRSIMYDMSEYVGNIILIQLKAPFGVNRKYVVSGTMSGDDISTFRTVMPLYCGNYSFNNWNVVIEITEEAPIICIHWMNQAGAPSALPLTIKRFALM